MCSGKDQSPILPPPPFPFLNSPINGEGVGMTLVPSKLRQCQWCSQNFGTGGKVREQSDRAGEGVGGVSPFHGSEIFEIKCVKKAFVAH